MTSIADSKPQVIKLSLEEFTQLSKPPRLIDVRGSFEYAMFHASDAVNTVVGYGEISSPSSTVNLSLPRILIESNY